MLAYEFIVKCKDHYHHLLGNYSKSANYVVEPVVSVAHIGEEKQMIFCHPEDLLSLNRKPLTSVMGMKVYPA